VFASNVDFELHYFLSLWERIEVRAAFYWNSLTLTLSQGERVLPGLRTGSV